MPKSQIKLDQTDFAILTMLQENCRTPLREIAKKLDVSKSTIHYRLRRLETEGVIEGYYAKINPTKIGKDFLTITLVRAKYGQKYHEKIGMKLAQLPGVWGVYFLFGENDFIVLSRSMNREEFMRKLETIIGMQEIERSNTQIVASIIKEDPRVELKA